MAGNLIGNCLDISIYIEMNFCFFLFFFASSSFLRCMTVVSTLSFYLSPFFCENATTSLRFFFYT